MTLQEFLCLSTVFQSLLGAFTKYRFLGVPQTYRIRPEPLASLSSVTAEQETVGSARPAHVGRVAGVMGEWASSGLPGLGAHLHPLRPQAGGGALPSGEPLSPLRLPVAWELWTLPPSYFIRTPSLENSASRSSLPLVNEIPDPCGEGVAETPPSGPRHPLAPSPCSLLLSRITDSLGPRGSAP